MCGIAGAIHFDGSAIDEPPLRAMAARLAHRGPDGEHVVVRHAAGVACGLAFRRLAVLDCDARAMQPMTTPDERFTLVFNGEVYNYRDLKARLSPRAWRTSGDAEVLLHALAEWGVEGTLPRLDGMFAFGLWDARRRTLTLARDRLGQKPLYYATHGANVAFASELAALCEWPHFDRAVDDLSLTHYLRYGYVPTDRSIYRGAWQLPAGAWAVASPDGFGPAVRWFDPALLIECPPVSGRGDSDATARAVDDFRASIDASEASTARAVASASSRSSRRPDARDVRAAVERAVRRQLVSDVPLGVFLSGGIDSSVTALCAKSAGPVRTFSIGFDDARYDETPYAEAVARHLGTEHRTFRVTPDVAADLPRLAGVFGEPFADSSALPTHWLSQQTRKHVTVALSGDGGDELFGGYDRYRASGLPRVPLPGLAFVGGWLAGGHPKSRRTRLGRLLAAAALPAAARYDRYVSLFDAGAVAALLGDDGSAAAASAERGRVEAFAALAADRGPVAAALAFDRLHYLPGDVLAKVDRCSMLHGLEVRSPFFDPAVLAIAGRLRGRDLLAGGPKRMLREAFSADLPAFVFRRRKAGFAVPIGQWLRGPLRATLHDHLFAADAFAARFSPGVVRRLVEDHDRGRREHGQRLYALLMLELWWQRFRSHASDASGETVVR